MPPRHDHEEHHRKPEWWNGISLGNVLTIGTLLVAAAVAWGSNEQKQAAQDKEIDTLRAEVIAAESRNEKRIDELRADMRDLSMKIDTLLSTMRQQRAGQ